MKIGIPKEIKTNEYRVAMTPQGVSDLVKLGHDVLVESHAGDGSGFVNSDYSAAGAWIVATPDEVWNVQVVVKVKEPIPCEYQFFKKDLILFTYLHLAAPGNLELTLKLIETGVCAIAYETVTSNGELPLLQPMSAIAGRMATQVAASLLEKSHGGKGILMGGIPGVRRANVMILGGGIVGKHAAQVAVGMGARVTILDINQKVLSHLHDVFGNSVDLLHSTEKNIKQQLRNVDVIIGAVLIPGAKAPTLITKEMIYEMEEGSVVIDVAVDQGGCIETCVPTTHENPTFKVNNVIHYCVANMPGAVPQTSTLALTNATLPYIKKLIDLCMIGSVNNKPDLHTDSTAWAYINLALPNGINVRNRQCLCKEVSDVHKL